MSIEIRPFCLPLLKSYIFYAVLIFALYFCSFYPFHFHTEELVNWYLLSDSHTELVCNANFLQRFYIDLVYQSALPLWIAPVIGLCSFAATMTITSSLLRVQGWAAHLVVAAIMLPLPIWEYSFSNSYLVDVSFFGVFIATLSVLGVRLTTGKSAFRYILSALLFFLGSLLSPWAPVYSLALYVMILVSSKRSMSIVHELLVLTMFLLLTCLVAFMGKHDWLSAGRETAICIPIVLYVLVSLPVCWALCQESDKQKRLRMYSTFAVALVASIVFHYLSLGLESQLVLALSLVVLYANSFIRINQKCLYVLIFLSVVLLLGRFLMIAQLEQQRAITYSTTVRELKRAEALRMLRSVKMQKQLELLILLPTETDDTTVKYWEAVACYLDLPLIRVERSPQPSRSLVEEPSQGQVEASGDTMAISISQ